MIILLICCGAFVGFINTIAGMATALSYGLFMMMGLPINVANGTTRVGVLLQFLTTMVQTWDIRQILIKMEQQEHPMVLVRLK